MRIGFHCLRRTIIHHDITITYNMLFYTYMPNGQTSTQVTDEKQQSLKM